MSKNEIFNEILNKLYNWDENCAYVGQDFELDLQGHSSHYDDNASRHLFTILNENLFERPTYKTFIALLDNYTAGTGTDESVDPEEVQENVDFINAITDTNLMKNFYQDIVDKELFDGDYNAFRRYLYINWFRLYARNYDSNQAGILDSSAFEHTFVGETKDNSNGEGSPMGFHNWIRMHFLEQSGELDYEGHIRKATRDIMLMVRFNWNGQDKVSSIFVGTSPEFEIAAYTLALILARKDDEDDNHDAKFEFEIDGDNYGVQLYCKTKWSNKHNRKKLQLQSAFPTAEFE